MAAVMRIYHAGDLFDFKHLSGNRLLSDAVQKVSHGFYQTFGTGIPTIIMVLKKNRPNTDVMIVDASGGFEKVGKSNQLRASDIKRITDTVIGRITTPGYSRAVTLKEIRENEYNLNIPRCIEKDSGAEHWDIRSLMFGGIPEIEIDELKSYWAALPGLRKALFAGDGYYAQLVAADVESACNAHQSVQGFRKRFADAFAGLSDYLKQQLLDQTETLLIPHEETVPFEKCSMAARAPVKNSGPKAVSVGRIDGIPGESDWKKCAVYADFCDPYARQILKSKSSFQLLHNGKTLFCRVQAELPEGAEGFRFPVREGKHDSPLWNFESMELHLASGGKRYQFIFAPYDCLADFLNGDRKWNCEDVKYTSRLEGKVWTGVLEVPLAEIRFEKDLLKNGCRFNVYRNCYYTKAGKETWEQGCFLPVYGAFGNVEKFGTLNLE